MIPMIHATAAVFTALIPLASSPFQDSPALRSFDVSGCELNWDQGLDDSFYLGVPYSEYEFLSGINARLEIDTRRLSAAAVADLVLEASGLFDGKQSSGDVAVASTRNSPRFLVRGPQSGLDAVSRNLEQVRQAFAPERKLVVRRWSAAASAEGLSAGLVDADSWAALTDGGALKLLGRWETELSPGATAHHDHRRFQPLVADYNLEIAQSAFAFDEVSVAACSGVRLMARYGGGLGGGWLRASFEINEALGDVEQHAFGGGGLILDGESVSERKLRLTVENQDMRARGFQLAGFLPMGSTYLVGLGEQEGGERREWFSVQVEGKGVGGVHRLTSFDGSKTTFLVENEGFSQSGFGIWSSEHDGILEGEGLLVGYMPMGDADELMSSLALARTKGRPVGPFTSIEIEERGDVELIEQLLELTAAKSLSKQSLSVAGFAEASIGRAELPLVEGAAIRAWDLTCKLNPFGFDVEVAHGAAAVDPVIGFTVGGLLVASRPSGSGWSVELHGSKFLGTDSLKESGGWGRPSLAQHTLARSYSSVRVDPGMSEPVNLGGSGEAPSIFVNLR